jgi:hypothetical protein
MPNTPSPPAAVFIADMPDAGLRGGNAHLTYRSGGSAFELVFPRPIWRRFLEREIRRLNAAEDAEQGRVVEMKPRRPRAKAETGDQRTCPD